MITSPSLSAPRSSSKRSSSSSLSEPGGSPRRSRSAADLAGPPGHAGNSGSSSSAAAKPGFHAVPPSDPLRQANRLPIKVLKMLTARTGHILHPEYLQPLPSTPVSPIEVRSREPSPSPPSRACPCPGARRAWRPLSAAAPELASAARRAPSRKRAPSGRQLAPGAAPAHCSRVCWAPSRGLFK